MFCPNCAAQNNDDQHYCRTCGLKLDTIAREVAEQFPSAEYAILARRKRVFESMGVFSLLTAGLIGLLLLLGKVFYYKLIVFGPDVLFGSVSAVLVLFLLASVVLFSYPKLFMNVDKLNARLGVQDGDEKPLDTKKLIDDRPFEPASVTERTTELLSQKK